MAAANARLLEPSGTLSGQDASTRRRGKLQTVPGGVQIRILGYVLGHAGTRILRTSLGTPQRRVAGVGAYGHRAGDGGQLARSLLAVAETDAEMGVREGAKMAKEPDVYTTIGHECGCCGHRHPSVREAGRCLAEYRRQEPSDRRVVAVAADAPWPPTEGRDLNDAELDALYADAGALAASDEHGRLAIFAAGVATDVAAVRRVADALHSAWAEGGLGRDTTEDVEIAAAGCRVIGLALATVERTADSPCTDRLRSC